MCGFVDISPWGTFPCLSRDFWLGSGHLVVTQTLLCCLGCELRVIILLEAEPSAQQEDQRARGQPVINSDLSPCHSCRKAVARVLQTRCFTLKVRLLKFWPEMNQNHAVLIHYCFLRGQFVNVVVEGKINCASMLFGEKALSPGRYLVTRAHCCLQDLAGAAGLPITISLNFRKQLPPNWIKNHGRRTHARQCLNINQFFFFKQTCC